MGDGKTRAMLDLLNAVRDSDFHIRTALVVGCGDGIEAAEIADMLGCSVEAIDAEDSFKLHHPLVTFRVMDARAMQFEDSAFDLVYSFHALEHIPSPERAIGEMCRVLRDGGIFCVGTPNRSRLLGYFSGRGASLTDKIAWNLRDWGMRLIGRFRNECGAHAGFTGAELLEMCRPIGEGAILSRRYYEQLYPGYQHIIASLCAAGLEDVLFPCVYVAGIK